MLEPLKSRPKMAIDHTSADANWEREIHSPDSAEASSWLQAPDDVLRTISGGDGSDSALSGDEALQFVQHLYQLGAARVTAIHVAGFEEQNEQQDTDSLIVELPQEPVLRKALFEWKAAFDAEGGWDAEPDEGQKYMLVWWP